MSDDAETRPAWADVIDQVNAAIAGNEMLRSAIEAISTTWSRLDKHGRVAVTMIDWDTASVNHVWLRIVSAECEFQTRIQIGHHVGRRYGATGRLAQTDYRRYATEYGKRTGTVVELARKLNLASTAPIYRAIKLYPLLAKVITDTPASPKQRRINKGGKK